MSHVNIIPFLMILLTLTYLFTSVNSIKITLPVSQVSLTRINLSVNRLEKLLETFSMPH